MIYATGHNEGRLTDEDIRLAAKTVKFNSTKVEEVQGTLDSINMLSQKLGVDGTPTLVVLPASGANADNVTVIQGFLRAEAMQTAINNAAGNSK